MTIIDGKKISEDILNEISLEVEQRTNKGYKTPHLAAILVGDDGPSQTYVNSKINACKEVGFKSSLFKYDNNITEKKLLEEIGKINNDDDIDGFIVQLPLPNSINQENILNCVNPNKDVDGFHPINYGKMTLGIDSFVPATPHGILELIKRYKIDLNGKKCLVIGRSQIVGRPISILLSQSKEFCNATVTLAHSRTLNLNELTLDADVIISAIGRPEFLTENMVKEGSIIIDVGISRVKDDNSNKGYKIVGDVDFKNVSKKTSFITPVPGGVGPMTIAMLLRNTLLACRKND
ncbi:MAG TPA: bifunctional 5,10-methylenetetrahydrofolate dehydrogenase/5,10-methenyltetrahydrofolate cyclohydrolase [Flavobacteriaceae bacterium]|jgi:methylenetetrahydrofolate dehydrogenase (NADP+)/methenyltetrahydrofolate cyclohydrolase|nr:bifunctional 5,10-methylene-tetrahydrofolate dehydrogenase/5,10-methylene-tetrahydrofolate cyclohydrolase [Flavobacteriaceae bacterium]MDP7183882.1 bifunctional 5,10-methylenetetrahydrofolate dehydrogenase/5,10-methenyltetrahydrofolate cyclohydrolase [Flavobacteriaceae bacterium]HJO70404.1 bifunctional 5,10-methylenetetrahydrofolate dehydrogenase/5,10-methenyltetrahydrofolate cyclohydrolase [Flavobacteriaceae bacterium]|tara:strand:- start:2793 stop:3668 length:876 start_codon:yes stop_codon:yes gene_type:complete